MSGMHMSRRAFLHQCGIAGLAFVTAACSPQSPAPVPTPAAAATTEQPATAAPESSATAAPTTAAPATIKWWNPDELSWQKAYEDIAKAFSTQNSEIKVEIGNVAIDAFVEKLTAAIAGKTAPDVWTYYHSTDTARHGFMANLTPYLERDGLKPADMWFTIGILRGEYKGQRYSVPRDSAWSFLVYNKDLMDEYGVAYPQEGWTTDDFAKMVGKLSDSEKGTWGTNLYGSGMLSWSAFAPNLGFEINSIDGTQVAGLLDSPASIEALQWVIDLEAVYHAAPRGPQAQALGDYPFGSGKIGFDVFSPWEIVYTKDFTFKWGVTRAPVKPGGQYNAWGDSVQHYMWSGSAVNEAAWKLLKYASGPEAGVIAQQSATWFSGCPKAWLDMALDKDPIMSIFWSESSKPVQVGNYLHSEYYNDCIFPDFDGIFTRYLESGERPLDVIVKDAAAKIQACLDDRYAG